MLLVIIRFLSWFWEEEKKSRSLAMLMETIASVYINTMHRKNNSELIRYHTVEDIYDAPNANIYYGCGECPPPHVQEQQNRQAAA